MKESKFNLIDNTPIDFPREELMNSGIFHFAHKLCEDRPDWPPQFMHGGIMSAIGAVVGRRVWLEDDSPVFPNQYIVLVGPTSTQKTTVGKFMDRILSGGDSTVIRHSNVITPEGIINPKGLEPGCKIKEEGFRIHLWLDGKSSLLKKSIETLIDRSDMKDVALSILGSTTPSRLGESVSFEDIQGGFLNRFSFYVADEVDPDKIRFIYPPMDKHIIGTIKKYLGSYRTERYTQPTSFSFDEAAIEYCEDWAQKVSFSIKSESVRECMSGYILHAKKFSLIYAMEDNCVGDHVIHVESARRGCILASYHINVERRLFGDFTISDKQKQKQEDKVYSVLQRKKGDKGMTPREVVRAVRSVENSEHALEILKSLEQSGFVGKTPIPRNPGRFRWHALKEVDSDRVEEVVRENRKKN